jgi:signal transduction histidine kinase
MKIIDTSLLPFPHYNNKSRLDGSILSWPKICQNCSQQTCKNANDTKLSLCPHGYNYVKVDNNITLAGFLIRDYQPSSTARDKRIRNEKQNLITKQMVEAAISAIKSMTDLTYKTIDSEKNRILQEYVKEEQYKTDFLQPLKSEIQKGLSFVHDYKQINTQISQNINVIIESRYKGDSLEDKLEKATREEKAIYAASKFLDEKLNVAKFLLHPEWLDKKEECVKYSFHGIVIKYRRIYAPRFEAKNMQISIVGKSYNEIVAHPQAVSVIPHTLIDNAAKYSPRHGKIEIYVQDIENTIDFSVSSFGPLIKPDEREKIFQPFYRTTSAKQLEEEGAGYGLYISQLIAKKHLGSVIEVKQSATEEFQNCYWTTFSINIPLKAAILP